MFKSFIMKLKLISGEVLGWGQFAPSGTLMLLKPWPLYNLVAPGLFKSQCNAIVRQPQLRAKTSAFAISLLAIPFRRNLSRTATFEMYAIPVLQYIHVTVVRGKKDNNMNWKEVMSS